MTDNLDSNTSGDPGERPLENSNSDPPDDNTDPSDPDGSDSGSSDSSTEENDYETEWREDLISAFEGITTPGTFAAWEALPTTPPAGLYVDGIGEIAMPLGKDQIQQLITKAHQAPFGRRSETLVDLSVRNTWEIDGDQLRFLDPAWQSYLLDLSKRVATILGIGGLIRSDLYKMLIYEKGAMFKPHTDTERTPGMFGTLIICLPSVHLGGEIVVRHNGEYKTLRTSDATQSFACWYSDVTHEILPVKSGYRCVLTYNLAIKPGLTRPVASALDLQKTPLRQTLQCWLNDLAKDSPTDAPSHLYHALDHEYTEAAMSFQTLKAGDFARVQVLRDLADELPFEIFLALLEKKDFGPVESGWDSRHSYKRSRHHFDDDDDNGGSGHHVIDSSETDYTVKSLRALDGTTIASNYDFDVEFCSWDAFEDLEIDREEYEPFQGNWGPSATHWYRRSALAIVPHKSLAEYLAQCASKSTSDSNSTNPALLYLEQVCLRPTVNKTMLVELGDLCKKQSTKPLPPATISNILKASLQHSHFDLFQTIAGLHQGHLPYDFFDWANEWLNMLPDVDRAEKYHKWFTSLIHGYPAVADRIHVIQKVSKSTSDAASPDGAPTIKAWAEDLTRQCVTNLLESKVVPTAADGKAIVPAVFSLNETLADTSALLTSIFDRFPQAEAIAFLLAFLSQLRILAGSLAQFPISESVELRKRLGSRVFNRERTPSNVIVQAKGKSPSETGWVVTPMSLVKFIRDLYRLSTDAANLAEPFIQQINEHSARFTAEDMQKLWMPFLYQLIPDLVTRSGPLTKPSHEELTRQFINRYSDTTLGPCPNSGTINRRSPQVRCPCGDCANLNNFLQDTSQRVWRHRATKAQRFHLHQRIDGANIDCTHVTNRNTNPETLVVTKRYSVQDEINKWTKQQKDLYLEISNKIQSGHLKKLLGAQKAAHIRVLAGLGSVAAATTPIVIDLT
ncbi:hypothetical protein PtA15_6A390 [Puccinia triticina]|uniref:Prolyl 4-hydroxylase alpha subunit Fe(2+) 2OG dioxygenase domain-containing protein n=1 Tax=Puccinia triticina TaxID=208348 RepID=A0ABY7CKK9_9BASI|nr:uncharacterized protein PtA15_6A390 [Puccinia triticina]WAQ85761.1 hypothetical protein PtA15_6A390 [Puccinia triticina]